MKSIYSTILIFLFSFSNARGQYFRFTQVDTITELDPFYLSTATTIGFDGNDIYHAFVYNNGNDNFREILGNSKISKRSSSGIYGGYENCDDTVNIRNILFKKDGGQVIVGRTMPHFKYREIDTIISFSPLDQNRSFILETDENGVVTDFEVYGSIGAASLDKQANVLYFADNINTFDSIVLYRKDLNTRSLNKISSIYTQQRNEELQILTTDDFIYVSGSFLGEIIEIGDTTFNTGFPYNTFIAQFSKTGQFHWAEFVEDITTVKTHLAAAPDQGVYFCAPLFVPTKVQGQQLNGGNWGSDFFLSRINSDGKFLWTLECPETKLTDFQIGSGDAIGSDNLYNVYLVGASRTGLYWDDTTFVGSLVNTPLTTVMIFDKDGKLTEHKVDIKENFSQANSVYVADHGNYIISGYFRDSIGLGVDEGSANLPGIHHYLAYYDNKILKKNNLDLIDELIVYPNPANQGFITINGNFKDNAALKIFDIFGRNLFNRIISNTNNSVEISNLIPGIYFLKIDGHKVKKLIVN